MITYIHTDCDSNAFKQLSKELDDELYKRYGKGQDVYSKFNIVSGPEHAIIATDGEVAIACGCFKKYSADVAELKRIFVKDNYRGKGIAAQIVKNALKLAKTYNYKKMILQTGSKQPEAMNLYSTLGFKRVENYGHYKDDDNSVCYEINLD